MKHLLILLAALLAVGAWALYMLETHADMQVALPTSYISPEDAGYDPVPDTSADLLTVKFSNAGSFYDDDIDVELSCGDGDAVIYYTDDGNDPDEDSKQYDGPIHLEARSREKCTTIKAVAVNGENRSDAAVKSYIVGKNVFERFDEGMLVFVLSSDEYNLYDYYNGVAVEGYLRDEYIRNEYMGGEINPTDPANYNISGRESERPMYVEVFGSNGSRLLSQAVGGRVVGGYSRAVGQKSWRLIARNEYSEGNGMLKYPFFTENTDIDGNYITRYDRITLRNGANDREFAGIRDELSMTLASEAGFPDAQAVTPAAVYLNGEYYGYAWLHEAYCEGYLEMMYGGSRDNFRIVGSKELEPESDNEEDEQAVADWAHVIGLAEKDLTFDLYFNRFCELVDIDDLMLYYAMQVYIDNKDWPGNNFKVWRYYPSEGENVTSPYLDGKWRFLFFDAEFAWGLYGAGYSDNTLKAVLTGKHMQGASHILGGLLKRADMREKFANTICELEAGAFSPDNVVEKLGMLIEKSDEEQMYALDKGYTSSWANEWTFSDSRQQIRDFAQYRPFMINKDIENLFGYSGTKYDVSVRAPVGADVQVGCLPLSSGQNVTVRYFDECSVRISAEPYEGYEIDRWEINGTAYSGNEITVDRSMADGTATMTVSLYLVRTVPEGSVHVGELYTSGSGDCVLISNTTQEKVNIRGWHLSDKISEPDRYTIPDIEIPAGGDAVIVMKDNKELSALMKHQTNFSLAVGETLYFSDADCNTVSFVPVLDLDEGRSLIYGADGKYHIENASEKVMQ